MATPPFTRANAPPRALVRWRQETPLADEPVVFFSVEGAPSSVCRTCSAPDGSLTFLTTLRGRVTAVSAGELVIARDPHRIHVRHLLPQALDLSELLDHVVHVEISQRYEGVDSGRRRATIDAEIRDAQGRFLLWARDGTLPRDDEARGLSFRALVDERGARLAVGHEGGVTPLRASEGANLQREGESSAILVSRVEPDGVALTVIRHR